MSRAERVNEILMDMTAFRKEAYQKEEILDELLELQKNLVNATFSEDHAGKGSLRIWDVEKHLERLNSERGNIANAELEAFEEKCKFICNLIKAEISGRSGEEKAFRALDLIYGKKRIIKNCEMAEGNERTELDAVVVTPKGIFIIEVKNTSKDITIDANGNYYKSGVYMNWDSNIGEKMNLKQKLLCNALAKAGFDKDAKIQNIVVFTTNNRIEVICRYEYIKTCFLSILPHVINKFKGYPIYSDKDMDAIVTAIEDARCRESYPMEIDMAQFKLDFAELMTTLEQAPEKAAELVQEEVSRAEEVPASKEKEYYKIQVSKKVVKKICMAVTVVIFTAVVLVGKQFFKKR